MKELNNWVALYVIAIACGCAGMPAGIPDKEYTNLSLGISLRYPEHWEESGRTFEGAIDAFSRDASEETTPIVERTRAILNKGGLESVTFGDSRGAVSGYPPATVSVLAAPLPEAIQNWATEHPAEALEKFGEGGIAGLRELPFVVSVVEGAFPLTNYPEIPNAKATLRLRGVTMYQYSYISLVDIRAVTISIRWSNPSDQETADEIAQSIRFAE